MRNKLTVKQKLGHILLYISTIFNFMSKLMLSPDNIVIDSLTLPGWFVLNDTLIFHQNYKDKKLGIGFEWKYWPMPDLWCDQLNALKKGK